jgi:hypothetical protein
MLARNGNPMNDNPVTQCQVTLNAAIDINAHKRWASLSDKEEDSDIHFPFGNKIPKASTGVVVHEIALKRRNQHQTLSKTKRRKIDPMLTPAFTNLAGCPLNIKKADRDIKGKVEHEFWKQFQPVGIVKTSRDVLNPDGTDVDYGRIDFALGIGGVDPVLNRGEKSVYAGNLIVCDLPKKGEKQPHERGTDEGKVLLVTKPYDYKEIVSMESLREIFNSAQNEAQLTEILEKNKEIPVYKCLHVLNNMFEYATLSTYINNTKDSLLEKLLHSFFESHYEYNSRVIGVALTDASPGQQFDLKVSAFGYCL